MNQQVTHFPQAISVKENIHKLKVLYEKYEKPTKELDKLSEEAGCFSVRLPLVGAFSCGKTTLINALIGEKLFAVEVNPETALPVELSYAPVPEFTGYTVSGNVKPMAHNTVLQQDFSDLLPDGWLQVKYPADNLKSISRLTLVDMPGWDSGIEQHSKAIDAYLHRSLAFCVVVSADEGNLRESLRLFIQELAIRKMPALVVIAKADKKPKTDVDAVQQQITAEITKILGQPPLGIVQVSARKKQIQSFVDLLHILQSRADERFSTAIINPVVKDSQGLEKRLKTLLNQDNLDAEGLQAKCKELEQEMQAFQDRVQMESEALDIRVESAAHHILRRAESSLMGQVSSLASQAVNGGDIKGNIGSTVRLAISEGIQSEFTPKLQAYFQRIESEVPNALALDVNIDLPEGIETTGLNIDTSIVAAALTPILTAILTKLALPALAGPIGAAVAVLISFLSGGSSKSKEDQEREQLESAKKQIVNTVIPQVISQVESILREHLLKQTEDAKQQILAAIRKQAQQHKETLTQLEIELKEGKEAFELKRQGYQQDLDQLKTIQASLIA